MEFLVRLVDKTNTSVHCLNPVHGDVKTIYDDPTGSLACPFCDSTLYLYRKNNAITKKGNFITYKPDGWQWGRMELRHYGIVRIDCTEEEAREFCKSGGMDPDFFQAEQRRLHQEHGRGATKENRDEAFKNLIALERSHNLQYRARVHTFDFETVLTEAQRNNWTARDVDSYIVVLTNKDKVHIK